MLRLKVLISLSKRADDTPELKVKETFAKIVEEGNLFQSNEDNLQVIYSDKQNQQNPFHNSFVKSINEYAGSALLIDPLKEFQDYRLLPKKTVFENISYALEVINMRKDAIRHRVRRVMNLVSLDDKGNSFPSELSGGQQQRVAIARAIANRPKVLIADEPTGNLDPAKSDEIMTLLEKINREEGTTILMVTHDLTLVNKHRKRTISLENGHIVADMEDGGYMQHVK